MRELLDLDLCAAAALLEKGEASPSELTAAAIARIEADPDARACFIRFDADVALEAARRLDEHPETLLLRGMPLAHKDLFSVPDRTVSLAAHRRFHLRGTSTAAALVSLEEAGALNLGALHLSEFAMGPTGWSEHYGFLRNPLDSALVTGGSSSGSAAAVARRLVFAALGTDTGGSIRIPAAFCEVVGLKPSRGLVPTRGCFELAESLDVTGPIARSVTDCARLLDVLVPPEAGSGYERVLRRLPALRFGVLSVDSLPVAPDPAVAAAYEQTLHVLGDMLLDLREVRIPDLAELGALNGIVLLTEASSIHSPRLTAAREQIGHQVAERLLQGLSYPGAVYLLARRAREKQLAAFRRAVFSDVDVLLLPTAPCLPPRRDAYEAMAGTGEILDFNGWLASYTPAFSYLGIPALSLPFPPSGARGFGLQMVADFRRETTLLQAARTVELAAATP